MLPVLSNVKLEFVNGNNQLTKTNLKSTCIANIAGVAANYPILLLDERIFFSFLTETSADTIVITYDDKQIKLSDGKTEIELSREDPTNFPKTPTHPDEDGIVITREQLASISIAKSFINDTETAGNFQFVHIFDGYIAGFHTHYFYVNTKYKNLPEIILTREQADLITGYENAMEFSKVDNHYFFTTNNAQYIFTRKEGKTLPIETVVTRLQLPGLDFTINKADLISFCSIANIVTEASVALCKMEPEGFFAKLEVNEADFGRKTHRDIPITGTFEAFNFNSKLIINSLKNIPYDTLQAKTNQNCLIVTGTDEYFCFLGMQK